MKSITLTNITGLNNPYSIYTCDVYGNNCVLVSSILTSVPPSITIFLPPSFDTSPSVGILIVTSDGCDRFEIYDCTPSPTPTPLPIIPPYFQVVNINGTNPLIIEARSAAVSSFDIDWGDGSSYLVNFTNPPFPFTFADYSFTHTYSLNTFTATCENFQLSSSLSTDYIREIKLSNISDIIENSYTFSAFTAATDIWLSGTTLTDFSSSLPNSLVDFYIYNTNAPGSQNFQFSPTTNLATLPVFRELLIQNTDMSGFTYNFSGSSSFRTLRLTNNNSLTNLNVTVPTGSTFLELYIVLNTSLPILNVTNNLSGCTGLELINVFSNSSLSGWTYTLPVSAEIANLNGNRIRNFDIDLSANTNLTNLDLNSNLVLSSFTNTISGCTSLTTLRLDNNNLTTLPPIFPNSIQTLRLDLNDITGYTSNFPTSCVTFNMSDNGPLQYVPQWTVDLTGATSLQTFRLDSVSLSGWTTQFPPSIKTISFRQNKLTNFDFNYTQGATSIDLFVNELTGTTNLSGHTSLVTLTISNNNFINSTQIIQGDFPSTLRTFTSVGSSLLTGWTSTFSAMTNILSINFASTGLKTAAVDFILDDVATIAVSNTLYNRTLNLSGTQSPTGGLTNPDYLLLTGPPYNWTVTITP
jgi:hypothetical protein